jgi:DNA-binding YbaB/EbfC family protein
MPKGPVVRGGMPELLRQARRVQERLEKVKEDLKSREETVTMADGKVVVTVTGERRVKSVKLSPDILKDEDLSMAEDLITGAVNSALEKIDEVIQKETDSVTGGMDIPGLF